MATKTVLDTDIWSEILKAKDPTVAERAREYYAEHGAYTLSVVTVMEVVYGYSRRSSLRSPGRNGKHPSLREDSGRGLPSYAGELEGSSLMTTSSSGMIGPNATAEQGLGACGAPGPRASARRTAA